MKQKEINEKFKELEQQRIRDKEKNRIGNENEGTD